MGHDVSVYKSRCGGANLPGHNIVVSQTALIFDPISKALVPQYESFCTYCGMPLDEIQAISKKRAPRKPRQEPINEAGS